MIVVLQDIRRRRLSIVVGTDDRSQVRNTHNEFPYTSIGQLTYINTASSNIFTCTAVLFSSKHIITNAHCVYDVQNSVFHSDWKFWPGQTETDSPFGAIECVPYSMFNSNLLTCIRKSDAKWWLHHCQCIFLRFY